MDLYGEMRADLKILLQQIGVVQSVEFITTLFCSEGSTENSRACYRVTFVDGLCVKARGMETAAETSRVLNLREQINSTNLSRILTFSDRALIEEWVEGIDGKVIAWEPPQLEEAGLMLAKLHDNYIPNISLQNAVDWFQRISDNLGFLYRCGKLDQQATTIIADRLAMINRKPFEVGIIHGDFCSDNLVQTHHGKLCVVDNETMRIAPLDFDLGRTLWRWPMHREQFECFLSSYSRVRDSRFFQRTFVSWLLAALIDSSAFRIRSSTQNAEAPLIKIRDLLRKIKLHQAQSTQVFLLEHYYE